ncbi:unnamed protein product [marine sediment metagenome]|uniref:Uncharacterized protein n=1 Tax=marine sediment metagenome TaxID=412755 RepID=X1RXM3_9ZZZZ
MDKWIWKLISLVIPVVTPALRDMLRELLNKLEESAKKTPNPYDDILVEMLKAITLSK